MTAEQLKNYMHEDIAHFWYTKTDGSIREAYGTLCSSCMPPATGGKPTKKTTKKSSSTISYFDLICNDWRCFLPERLIRVDDYGI